MLLPQLRIAQLLRGEALSLPISGHASQQHYCRSGKARVLSGRAFCALKDASFQGQQPVSDNEEDGVQGCGPRCAARSMDQRRGLPTIRRLELGLPQQVSQGDFGHHCTTTKDRAPRQCTNC